MTRTPRVSVLMAVHNGQTYLEQAIGSLLSQTLSDFELVVVDDASTDNTPELLELLARRDDRIVWLRNETNLGVAATLNRGLAVCRASLVARADADDVFVRERLEKQTRFMEDNSTVGVLGTAVEFIDENNLPREDKLSHFHTQPADLRFHTHLGCCFWHSTVMFRAELVRSVGAYDAVRFVRGPEDYDLWARLIDKTVLQNLPDVLVKQRLHGNSVTATWTEGFELYCSVARRLLSRYLNRPLDEREARDVVTLFGWTGPMSRESILNGVRLLREIRTCARVREDQDTFARFERQCVSAFCTEAAIMVYANPVISRQLMGEAIGWSPKTLLSFRALVLGARLATPAAVREVFKRAKQALTFQ